VGREDWRKDDAEEVDAVARDGADGQVGCAAGGVEGEGGDDLGDGDCVAGHAESAAKEGGLEWGGLKIRGGECLHCGGAEPGCEGGVEFAVEGPVHWVLEVGLVHGVGELGACEGGCVVRSEHAF